MQMWLEDITHRPSLLQIARDMATQNYCQVYGDSNASFDAEELWSECRLVGVVSYYRTLMTFGKERDEIQGTPLATVTFRLGSRYEGDGPPLEFMRYMTPACGWAAFDDPTFNPKKMLEISMFAFSPSMSGPDQLAARIQIFRVMHSCVLLLAEQHGCSTFWSVLTRVFARFVSVHCQLPCEKIDGMFLNEAEHGDLFDRLPKYWRQGKPAIYATWKPAQKYASPFTGEIVE